MNKVSGLLILWGLITALSCFAQKQQTVFPFHVAKGAGTFRLGVSVADKSRWLDECAVRVKGHTYTVKDALLGKGALGLTIYPLVDTDGFIVEVSGSELPEQIQLCWAFGGCDDTFETPKTNASILPETCRDNVFSDEGQAVTVYYGKVMGLKVIQGVTPPNQGMRLGDAYHQTSPLALYTSGKNTDAPVVTALCPWKNGEKYYFCFYTQNEKADYNYFMLPKVFTQSAEGVATNTNTRRQN